VRGDVAEGQRAGLFAGHSLRACLASSTEMTRKYQRRRDCFRINLTKAVGLVGWRSSLLSPVINQTGVDPRTQIDGGWP